MYNSVKFKNMIDESKAGQEGELPEIIDVEEFAKNGWPVPRGKRYRVKIGEHYYIFDQEWVTGREILEKAEYKHLECHILYLLIRGCELERIELDRRVDLTHPKGILHFVVAGPDEFHYTVDGEKQTTEHEMRTPNQILEKAGIGPVKDYYLTRVKPTEESYKGRMNDPIKMLCPPAEYVALYDGPTPVS
jgi:hypothetical protein